MMQKILFNYALSEVRRFWIEAIKGRHSVKKIKATLSKRANWKLRKTYRIRRSFCPRKIPLVSKIEASHNFAIELGIFQSWQKFG